jgi:hypothetical protein
MILIETVDLEVQLASLFARMLSISPRVGRAIMLAPKSEQARLDILKHAAEAAFFISPKAEKDSELSQQKQKALERVLKIVSKSQDLMNKRHRIAHDEWAVLDENNEIRRIPVSGKLKREEVAVPINELEDHILSIRTCIDDAHKLASDFREHPPTMADLRKSSTNSR